ncbi:MAG: carotenoid oxygenase [Linnemannia elongata]|nr:MAG: carotenoid oxygenase [Linnemannia elongata]
MAHINFSTEEAAAGWKTQARETLTYWVPEVDIKGALPKDLVGTFFRNGPGNDSVGSTKLTHPIDGDGLIVALSFPGDGHVHFNSRFVQSRHRVEEKTAQKMIYRGQMGTDPNSLKSNIAALVKAKIGWEKSSTVLTFRNPSNTNVYMWEGKVLSAHETSLPHCLDPTTLETIGEETLDGTLQLNVLGAHFRYDPFLDRLVTMSAKAGVNRLPSLQINEYGRQWAVKSLQTFHIPGLNYAHDLLLSKNFYIVQITPFVNISTADVYKFFLGLSSPGDAMRYYEHLPCRLVIIARTPQVADQILGGRSWIEADIPEPCHIFHFGNVQELVEKDRVVGLDLTAVCLGKKFNMEFENKTWLSNASKAPGLLTGFKVRFGDANNASNDKVWSKKPLVYQTVLHPASVEFPAVHPYRHGQDTRFTYMMASSDPKRPHYYTAVLKHDLHGQGTKFWQSEGVTGEPCFIPRGGYAVVGEVDQRKEDDGFVVVQVYHPKRKTTDFAVLDAQTMELLATIGLKHHVPFGFHGTFTPELFVQGSAPPSLVPAKL